MAVQTNPYRYWEDGRDEADYRSRETQASSLTRQMLRQPEYFRDRNRVNPGPGRNIRARVADATTQTPHHTHNEDVWGWQSWRDLEEYYYPSDISDNLLESPASKEDVPLITEQLTVTSLVFNPGIFEQGVFE